MKCGYCLPHCPTYGKTRNEADSPRGRIALIQGWVAGELEMTGTLAGHLDGCLTCRACEAACPSLVAYGHLADATKARRVDALPRWRRALGRLGLAVLSDPRTFARLGRLGSLYRRSGLASLAKPLRLTRTRPLAAFHRLALALGVAARPLDACEPDDSDLDLFVGCVGSSVLGGALLAAAKVCEHLGLRVRIPAAASCCGALMRHNGYIREADRYRANCARLHADRTLVGLASACIAELREQPELRGTWEICDYLDQAEWSGSLALRPLRRRILVHEPCSHRNLLGGNAAVFRLLARIPDAVVAPLPDNGRCCGAAGTYLIQQPEMAELLLADKMVSIRELKPDIIVTTNPGCALHLLAGIQEAGLEIEVCHPVELIARQLEAV